MTVTAHLHGGPRNGETFDLGDYARHRLDLPDWDSGTVHRYYLRPPWVGQERADYDYALPAEVAA